MNNLLSEIIRHGCLSEATEFPENALTNLQQKIWQRFGRALAIRHVDAGSCNGCELEIHALQGAHYNLVGLGIHFTASPRHADLLLVTGPVTRAMAVALQRTYAAMPAPKWVVAMGDCARDGGLFGASYACVGSVAAVIPVDITLAGCAPTPEQLLQAIWQAVSQSDRVD